MASIPSKRKSIHATKLNFRPNISDANINTTGTKPTTAPTSIQETLTIMLIFICKKLLFYKTYIRVAIYLGALFLVSLIADVVPTVPKVYFGRSDNIFNKFFVKYAWGWNLLLLLPFVSLTSFIYCCGQKNKILFNHIIRIVIATGFWWVMTTFFNFIEASFGKCIFTKAEKGYPTKVSCLQAGHVWNGFDISGHSFILVYGSLLLIEEARSMVNWDSIKEHIRLEEHARMTKDTELSNNPLRNLTELEFKMLQVNYEKFTPYIRALFITITCFQVLWDIMLLSTILYYHVMVEKLLGGLVAIMVWYLTYELWYTNKKILPSLPGDGVFKYIKKTTKDTIPPARRRAGSIVNGSQVPKFMGRPIYAQPQEAESGIR